MAATSWNRAGSVTAPAARTIVTRPSSSGWRSASRTSRENSASSSRKRTPLSARVTSPGTSRGPPPTIAAYELVWCGARNGGATDEPADRRFAGDGGDDRRAEGLLVRQRRQEGRDRAGEHRLAGPRRPDQEQPVPARERDLERSARLQLSSDVGQVRRRQDGSEGRHGRSARAGDRGRRHLDPRGLNRPGPPPPPQGIDSVAERRNRHDLEPVDQPCLRGAVRRHDHPPDTPPGQRRDHRQQPGHGPDLAPERHLADQRRPPGQRDELLGPDQDPDRDRKVGRGARLRNIGRCEVDRDPSRWVHEPRVAKGAADPLAGLADRRVTEANDGEPGQARRNVDLDADDAPIEGDERCGQQRGQHAATLRSSRLSPAHPDGRRAGGPAPASARS